MDGLGHPEEEAPAAQTLRRLSAPGTPPAANSAPTVTAPSRPSERRDPGRSRSRVKGGICEMLFNDLLDTCVFHCKEAPDT